MSDIPIPPINTLVNLQPAGVSNTSQNPSQSPNPLTSLPNGTIVTGFVINRDAHNQPVLRTPQGDVLVNTNIFLKTGAEVVLRVDTAQPGHARLISINGQTPEAYVKLQATQIAIVADEVITTAPLITSGSTIPKPVELAGYLLKIQPEATIPKTMADNALKALGLSPSHTLSNNAIPISIVLRAITGRNEVSTPAAKPSIASAVPASIPPTSQQIMSQLPANEIHNTPQQAPVASHAAAPLPATLSQTSTAKPATGLTPAPQPHIPSAASSTVSAANPASPEVTIPPLRTDQQLTRQNFVSSQSYIPDALPEHHLPTSSRPVVAAEAYQPKRSAQTVPPLPTESQLRQPGEIHSAFKGLLPPEPAIVITELNHLRMQARVIGQEITGDSILHTPLGVVKALTPKPLPPGSEVSIEIRPPHIENKTSAPALPSSLPDDLQEFTQIARDWPALSRLLESLQAGDPALYQSTIKQMVPHTGPALTHGLLFFLSALKGGDIKNWMGERTLKALQARQPELLLRLATEFSVLQQASVESSQQGWMSTVIPILHEGALHQARMFIRHEQEEQDQAQQQKNNGQRFIIEIDFSQLGEMQFDGFVMKDAARNQFDMIVRSTRPLPLSMQQDIRTLYDNAAGAAGFKGMLTFQATPDQFVRPLSSMGAAAQPGILA